MPLDTGEQRYQAPKLLRSGGAAAYDSGLQPKEVSVIPLRPIVYATLGLCFTAAASTVASAQTRIEYRVLATTKTSTMQKELNEAGDAGYKFADVMGGPTSFGGSEVVVILTKPPERAAYEYRLLATNKTSTMQKEMQEAGDAGFEYRGQTAFKSTFGGKEVITILERRKDAEQRVRYEYRLLATSKTSTMQKELQEAGDAGFEFVGLTVAKTAIGGEEVVSILRRRAQ